MESASIAVGGAHAHEHHGPPEAHAPPMSMTARMPRNRTVMLAASPATPIRVSPIARPSSAGRSAAAPKVMPRAPRPVDRG